jgi:hypothetical protein
VVLPGCRSLANTFQAGSCPRLTTLDISRNEIWGLGPESLAGALRSGALPHLRVLNLSKNYIGASGAGEIARSALLRSGPDLILDIATRQEREPLRVGNLFP